MSLIGSLIGAGVSVYNTGMQIRENAKDRQFQAEQAKLAYERSLSADSTKYQRSVADMKAAGINPMLAAGSSGGSVQSPAASGGSSSTVPLNLGDALALQDFELRKRKVDAEVENTEASTNKIKSETTGIDLANEISALTKDAQVEYVQLRNQLTSDKSSEIHTAMKEMESRITKQLEEAKTEDEKRQFYAARAVLSSAEAKQIVELLPYQKALSSAQTDNQKAAAALAAAHTAYQNGLIDGGYLDAFIDNMVSQATSAKQKAELDKIKTAVRTGDYTDVKGLTHVPVISEFISGIANFLDNMNPLSNILK